MAPGWRTLHLDHDALPQLLWKAKLDTSGYTIHLTDLSRVWGETLPKREIARRALLEDCGIDPLGGEDQLSILLDKIGQALNQEDGASLTLRSHPDKDDDLLLSLTAPLPAPLPELKWNIHLTLLSAEHVECELVTPLLQRAQNLQTQLQLLIQEIHYRDRVISKITDRLETSGNDLTTVFPGVSSIRTNKKKSQREQLARHVKGLADFDEDDWKAQHASVEGRERLKGPALDSILQNLPTSAVGSADDASLHEGWWRGLNSTAAPVGNPAGVGDGLANGDPYAAFRSRTTEPEGDMDTMEDVDSEFQRQGTPPHVQRAQSPVDSKVADSQPAQSQDRRSRSAVAVTAVDDESTEDEDDLDALPKQPVSSRGPAFGDQTGNRTVKTEPVTSSPRQVSGLDEPSQNSPSANAASPPPQRKPRTKLGTIGGKAKQASPTPTPEPETPPAATSAPAAKPRSKLGLVGGKAKASGSSELEQGSKASIPPSPSPVKHSKLGVIGGKKGGAAPEKPFGGSDENEELPRQSRAPRKQATPAPRETSAERADRKRNELKRQLEEQAKAPVKKKRKF